MFRFSRLFLAQTNKSNKIKRRSILFYKRTKGRNYFCTKAANNKISQTDEIAFAKRFKELPDDPDLIMQPTERTLAALDLVLSLSYVDLVSTMRLVSKRLGFPDPSKHAYTPLGTVFANIATSRAPPAQTSAAPVQDTAAVAATAQQAQPVPQGPKKKTFSVILKSYPEANKIKVIKEFRTLKPGMDILESKKIVDVLPSVLIQGIFEEDIQKWKTGLSAAAAEVDVTQDPDSAESVSAGSATVQPVQEGPKKKTFSVVLKSYPESNKIKVIKEFRTLKPGMDILESKKLIDTVPSVLIQGIFEEDFQKWKNGFAAASAEVDFSPDP
eukprot:TRINITY_DN11828_c0_g1_i1.p1 TRINITY_DN11828_c0_g1~~TRINITY_DN11828_c0_g1_i1.p1  ORF type:complete len:327 (+),score=69.95 TRINITY_DN11828_c0_g1_i1:71-1051(+)